VRAIDAAGNVDTTPATYTWTVVAGNIVVDGGVVDAGQSEAQAPIDGGIDSVRADRTPDAQGSIAEPGADAATVVALDAAVVKEDATVNADAATVVKQDAASQIKDDAATGEKIPQLLGGGFCAIASSRTASPSSFLFLALAGLALLRRRRR
jgi:MYXO-CTERM domain-containing protein